jgi:hypothetical protein
VPRSRGEQIKARMHEKVCAVLEERFTSVLTIGDLVRAYRDPTFPGAGLQITDDSRVAGTSRANIARTRRERS